VEDTCDDSASPGAPISDALGVRLRRIEGQIRGIARMIEDDRSCEDIVTQFLAARSAMDRVAVEIVRLHADRCLRDMPPEMAREQLIRIIELMSKISK
jgi:CsoR family transcriptional regulator, copper-sensing transcriptional repressor